MKKNNSKNTLRHLQEENKRLQKALKEATGKFNEYDELIGTLHEDKKDEGGCIILDECDNWNDIIDILVSTRRYEVSISMIANDRLENDSVKITISQIKEHEKKFENEEVFQNA